MGCVTLLPSGTNQVLVLSSYFCSSHNLVHHTIHSQTGHCTLYDKPKALTTNTADMTMMKIHSPTISLRDKTTLPSSRVVIMAAFLLLAIAVPTASAATTFPGAVPTTVAFVAPNKSHVNRRKQTLFRMMQQADEGEQRNGFNGIPSSSFPKKNGVQMNPLDDFNVGGSASEEEKNGASTKKNDAPTKNVIPSFPNSQTLPPMSSHIMSQLPNGGRITLVGSGPGDPSLLTVAADRLLRDPNVVVIADRLVSAEIMDTLATAHIHVARKWPGCAEQAQEEIYHWTYQALLQGRHVVRLKIGDPFVFGRGAEEVLTFRKWGLEPKVIPGVSAALSAPLLGSIPVTHRGVANQLVICTGYGKEGTCPDLIRYHPEQTVVFLMAVGRLRELSQKLQQLAGYPSDMPIAIVERAACPNQRTIVGTLETIGDIAEQHQAQAPSTIVVGRVVNVLLDQDQTVITAESATPAARAALASAISAAVSQQASASFDAMQNSTASAIFAN